MAQPRQRQRIKILVVDDEIGIRTLLSEILIDEGYAVVTAHDAESAYHKRIAETPDIILLDIWMPGADGIALMRRWADEGFLPVPLIVMSGHATIANAVEATKLGALEVLEKPITIPKLVKVMEKAKTRKQKQEDNLILYQTDFGGTPVMKRFKKALAEASTAPGLITLVGGMNSGAAFYARFLARPKSPVLVLDSGAALEGSIADIVRRAENGVIIARLVNVFNAPQQNGMLGLIREAHKSEVTLVGISTEAPEALAERGDFNDTLANLMLRHVVHVPPLSHCAGDLPHIIGMISRQVTTGTDMEGAALTPAAAKALAAHYYEDDFAELMSVIRSVFLYAQGKKVEASAVRAMLQQMAARSSVPGMLDRVFNMPLRDAREHFEQEYFVRLINMTNGNMQQAAKIAGLDRTYFYRKLKQYKTDGAPEARA